MNKRRTYWLTDLVSAKHRERALMLNQKGYDVSFFTSLDSLRTEVSQRRASVLVVDDEGQEKKIEQAIVTLANLPELQGARLILSMIQRKERIATLAAGNSFRDIIPMDLDNNQWIQRFLFSTGSRPSGFSIPSGQITMSNIASIALPARIVWMSETRVRIESRIDPPIGSKLTLHGAFADALGLPFIQVTVKETHRSHLLYRFSDAIVATWEIPAHLTSKAQSMLSDLRRLDQGPRCRVFVAAQTPKLRAGILDLFTGSRFELSAALQKQNLMRDPRYFTPHVIAIEDSLCVGENALYFKEMLSSITPEQTEIVIFSESGIADEVKKQYPHFRISVHKRLNPALSDAVLGRFAESRHRDIRYADSHACHIQPDHPLSFCELSFHARMRQIHPMSVVVACPMEPGAFGLARVESPILRKMLGYDPFFKITEIHRDHRQAVEPFNHIVGGYLADVSAAGQKILAHAMMQLIVDYLGRYTGHTRAPEISDGGNVIGLGESLAIPKDQDEMLQAVAQAKPLTQIAVEPALDRPKIVPQIATILDPHARPGAVIDDDYIPRHRREPARKKPFDQRSLKPVAVFMIVTLFLLGAIGAVGLLMSDRPHSGRQYTDSLKQFRGDTPPEAPSNPENNQ